MKFIVEILWGFIVWFYGRGEMSPIYDLKKNI